MTIRECSDCEGTGRSKVIYLTVDPHDACDGNGCSECEGTGTRATAESERCDSCKGSGRS